MMGLTVFVFGVSLVGSSATLNVCFELDGKGVNSAPEKQIIFTAYRVATVEKVDEAYKYTLTEPFKTSNIDIDDFLTDAQPVDVKSNAYKMLLTELGKYINENVQTIKAVDNDMMDEIKNVRTAPTMTYCINGEEKDGIAQFTNLMDGLYLITTNVSVWINGIQYIPVPFLICIPYVFDGELSNYVTVGLKYSEWDPSTSGGPNDAPNDIPNDEPKNTPQKETEIEILPDDVPLTDMPDDLLPDEQIEIKEVLLAKLPQTGQLWWPVPLMVACGIVLMVGGILVKKRVARDV